MSVQKLAQKLTKFYKKPINMLAALLLLAGMTLPILGASQVFAYGQITSRAIQMSTSTPGATASYVVSFTTATASGTGVGIDGIVIQFCDNDPIIGDTCITTAGSINTNYGTTLAISAQTGITGNTISSAHSTATQIVLNNTGSTQITAGTAVSITFTGITNPNYTSGCTSASNCSFYARILTYTTAAAANAYSCGPSTCTIGTPLDAGGIALVTNPSIVVTSKVQEVLTFCVYTAGSCASGGSTVTLGNPNGVLNTGWAYVDKHTEYDIQTNALHGASILAVSSGSLTSPGSNTIEASANSGMGAVASTAYGSTVGSPQFGFCTYETTGANLTTVAPYNSGSCNVTVQTAGTALTSGGDAGATFAYNLTNLNPTHGGDQIATATAGPSSTGVVAFIGNISSTNVAGIYTATITFVATGTY
jgi:hypothetical protein